MSEFVEYILNYPKADGIRKKIKEDKEYAFYFVKEIKGKEWICPLFKPKVYDNNDNEISSDSKFFINEEKAFRLVSMLRDDVSEMTFFSLRILSFDIEKDLNDASIYDMNNNINNVHHIPEKYVINNPFNSMF
jgi:hypothetical protein